MAVARKFVRIGPLPVLAGLHLGAGDALMKELGLKNDLLAKGGQSPPFGIARLSCHLGLKRTRRAVELGRRAAAWQHGGAHCRWNNVELPEMMDQPIAGARRAVQVGRWAAALGRNASLSLVIHVEDRSKGLPTLPRV